MCGFEFDDEKIDEYLKLFEIEEKYKIFQPMNGRLQRLRNRRDKTGEEILDNLI